MISWWWILPAFLAGTMFGLLLATVVIAEKDDRGDDR